MRYGLMLPSTDDEEEELVQTKAHKKSSKLNFSGKGLAGLLLLSVHFVSLGSILIISSKLHLRAKGA
jgi:hypothetical protein